MNLQMECRQILHPSEVACPSSLGSTAKVGPLDRSCEFPGSENSAGSEALEVVRWPTREDGRIPILTLSLRPKRPWRDAFENLLTAVFGC